MIGTVEQITKSGSADQFALANEQVKKVVGVGGYFLKLKKVLMGLESFYAHEVNPNTDSLDLKIKFLDNDKKCRFSVKVTSTVEDSVAFWSVILALIDRANQDEFRSLDPEMITKYKSGIASLLHVLTHAERQSITKSYGEEEYKSKTAEELKAKLLELLGLELQVAPKVLKRKFIEFSFVISS